MITLGVDPSLSSTGIVLLQDGIVLDTYVIRHCCGTQKGRNHFLVIQYHSGDESQCKVLHRQDYTLEPNPAVNQLIAYDRVWYWFLYDAVKYSPDHIGIEVPMGVHSGKGAIIDRFFACAVLALNDFRESDDTSWQIHQYNPSAIKKFITGRGNCKKELVLKEVYRKFGFDTTINDIADAFALAKLVEGEFDGSKQ
jgi:hypothetical protein